MKQTSLRRHGGSGLLDGVEFPANPFVALADFLLVLLLIFALGYAAIKIGDESLYQRLSVERLQERMSRELHDAYSNSADAVVAGSWGKHVSLDYKEGDLQRWWIDGTLFYEQGSAFVGSKAGHELLVTMGKTFASVQGNADKPGSGYFKRIIIEGHADRSEGDDLRVWQLSLARAQEAALILQKEAGIHPRLLEVSGRGCWWPRAYPSVGARPGTILAENRRLEIVVVYSPEGAQRFLRNEGGLKSPPITGAQP